MKNYLQFALIMFLAIPTLIFAGNPDRQGEAGAGELLLNPWARSAGFHSMDIATVAGVEAMRLNVAGIGRIEGRELLIANTRLYEGSDLSLNSLGFVQKSKNGKGAWGLSIMTVDFGEIEITTVNLPEGTGGTYSPGFLNLGIGYSHTYENKISVGFLFRFISEALPTVSATGFALDAGVQYVSGERDNFRLGIALRNVGTPMRFGGEGLAIKNSNPEGTGDYTLKFDSRSQRFELPSLLNIGISYDFFFGEDIVFRTLGNFTSNAFSRDNVGVAAELTFRERFSLRAGYKQEIGNASTAGDNLYTGISAGASVLVPLKKSGKNKLGVDYAYRATNPFRGTHNFSLRFAF